MGNRKHSRKGFFKRLYYSYIPNKRDSIGQILVKSLFIICLVALIVSASVLLDYYLEANEQDRIAEDSRDIWYSADNDLAIGNSQSQDTTSQENKPVDTRSPSQILMDENNDFRGWIRIYNTKVNYPIYQTDNNDYYLTHNQQKKRSAYGALYFDCDNVITKDFTDKNLVIYGHEMKNGAMFGTLKKLRSLDFYKNNPTVEFSTIYNSGIYKIYSVFVLNADKADDNGSIYNIYRKDFYGDYDFDLWYNESIQRSVIKTNVDVKYGDEIITLVTCCEDFDNARLVVMARKTRAGEETSVNTAAATLNPNPRYPARWYTDRGLAVPEFK